MDSTRGFNEIVCGRCARKKMLWMTVKGNPLCQDCVTRYVEIALEVQRNSYAPSFTKPEFVSVVQITWERFEQLLAAERAVPRLRDLQAAEQKMKRLDEARDNALRLLEHGKVDDARTLLKGAK